MNTKVQTVEREDAHRFDEIVNSDYGRKETAFPAFLKDCKKKRYCAKEVIYHESGQAHTAYMIQSGMVKFLSYLPNGRSRIVRLHSEGAWLGLGGLFGQPYEHTAVCIDDVVAYCIPVDRLLQLRLREPQRFIQFMDEFYEHLREADVWISEFSTGAIKPRVARLLGFLSTIKYGASSALVELLTVHEMADILGVTPESVSRIVAEFKRNGVLSKHLNEPPRDMYRLDTRALQSVAMH